MDPICHTLTGAAMAQAGLKRRTGLALATLLIAANLPDIDVSAYVFGNIAALEHRRGWTHGILALAVLPAALTGLIVLWDRMVRRPRPGRLPVRPREVLLLAFLGVLSHYFLDFLNAYGIRLLMPFSGRWFYGDALFIIDPWMWLALAAGVWLTIRRRRLGLPHPLRPARAGLALAASYALLMIGSNVAGRAIAADRLPREGIVPSRLMVYPVPVDPFTRYVMFETGDRIGVARLLWRPRPRFELTGEWIDTGRELPEAKQAAATPEGRRFLRWARFPYYDVTRRDEATVVRIVDARFDRLAQQEWAAVTVRLPPGGEARQLSGGPASGGSAGPAAAPQGRP